MGQESGDALVESMDSQLGVEPRHLAALAAVDDTGSFRGAAARLAIAQSAVSHRVAQLERLVGIELVERTRGPGRVRLTEAGKLLRAHAGQMLAQLDAAMADLRSVANAAAPVLRVGAYESVASRILPSALKCFARVAPEASVLLYEDPDWPQFFPMVADGRLDVAFADLPLEPGPFAFQELMHDPCMLLLPAASELADLDRQPTLAEIAALPLIAGSWPMQRLINDYLRTAGAEPQYVYRAELNSGVQSLVAEGLGAALVPQLSANVDDPRVVAISLAGVLPSRRIALYWHSERLRDCEIRMLLGAVEAQCQRMEQQRAGAVPEAAFEEIA